MPKQSPVDRLEALNLTARREEIEAAKLRARRIRFSETELAQAADWRAEGLSLSLIARLLDKSDTALRTALSRRAQP